MEWKANTFSHFYFCHSEQSEESVLFPIIDSLKILLLRHSCEAIASIPLVGRICSLRCHSEAKLKNLLYHYYSQYSTFETDPLRGWQNHKSVWKIDIRRRRRSTIISSSRVTDTGCDSPPNRIFPVSKCAGCWGKQESMMSNAKNEGFFIIMTFLPYVFGIALLLYWWWKSKRWLPAPTLEAPTLFPSRARKGGAFAFLISSNFCIQFESSLLPGGARGFST